MHFSSTFAATACLALLLTAGCQKELGIVTIEGDIAPELQVSGDIYFSTFRGLPFCKRNLLQAPHPKDKTVHAELVRTRDHYKLIYDSRDAPRGGICDWRPDGIVVEVHMRSHTTADSTILHITPAAATNRYTRERPRPEKVMQVNCEIDYSARRPYSDCDRAQARARRRQ